jgi:tetratricopeptide (TPR) repeat protein
MDKAGSQTGQQTFTIEQALELAVQHHSAGRLSEAERIYQRILQAIPDQPVAMHLLGVLTHQSGETGEAVKLVTKAIASAPNYAEAHSNLGNMLQDLGRLEEAVASYRKALDIEPNYVGAHSNLGLALRELGQLDDAVAFYRKALGIQPNFAEAHYNLGNALKDQGRLDEAATSYGAALSIKPDYMKAHYGLGRALQKLGKLEEAVDSYRKALALDPDYAKAHSNLGAALQNQGKLDEAIDCFHKAIALDDSYAHAHKGLGMTFHLQGRLAEAKRAYKAGIARNPKPDITHVGLRRVLIDLEELPVPASERAEGERETETSPRGVHFWNRPVEKALRETLYRLATMSPEEEASSGLEQVKLSAGIRVGNVRFSTDFELFELENPVIAEFKDALIGSLSSRMDAKIFVTDSFFNIYHAGSKAVRHNHIVALDETLGVAPQKFSLVYYIDPGDPTAEEPGVLELHDPEYSFCPKEGDIILFPSRTDHSASYSGASDRVILGVNFYTI